MAAMNADPIREAFRRRAMGAVDRMAREAPAETLAEFLAAATDTGTLARATADQAASEALHQLEPLAAAIARGAEVRARLVTAAGGLLSADDVGNLLGITRAAVDKRRASGKLLALRIRSDWAYPAVQFRDGEVLEGITDVLAGMADASSWSILDFLLAPDDALGGRTPLAALRAGELAAVQRLLAARGADAFA
ncbi:hypothetical protein [Paracraurococcus lichenis]|uniref:DNA-binding protein n=1 Tax=Paracraurococcus lichenis TaxID=3064888 RepID=A0ABT9ECE5_9PROT|nr:hypothetical protein [Paracraurococcus sp. LOR1-02]MDO9713705.1 hypothetical protein [Paracraurococcus sp. LOR1-02]